MCFNINDQYLYFLKCFGNKNNNEIKHEKSFYEQILNKNPFISKYFGEIISSKSIIINYIPSQSLNKYIQNNDSISFNKKIKIIFDILIAIEYIHSKDIILRDLNPENILIDSNENAILIDFDLSKINISDESLDLFEETGDIGSIHFMAPEQRNSNKYSKNADIYSLGKIIHFILTKDIQKQNSQGTNGLYKVYKPCFENTPEKRPTINQIIVNFITYIIDIIITNNDYEGYMLLNELNLYLKITSDKNNSKVFLQLENIRCDEQFKKSFITNNNLEQSYMTDDLDNYEYNDYDMVQKSLNLLYQKSQSNTFLQLGKIYCDGNNVKQDYNKAKKYFEKSANQNNADALLNLGIIYIHGYGVEQNFIKAKEYFEKSANQNNADALFNLGNLYFNGYGVDQDYIKAKEYFEKSADLNNSYAYYFLGMFFFYGYGVEQDYTKAKEYYNLSAEKNNSYGLLRLGNLCYNVEEEYRNAENFYNKSSNQNNSIALINALHLHKKENEFENLYLKIKKYFELSSKISSKNAIYNLANIYLTENSVENAKRLFEVAIKLNNSRILLFLGIFSYNGYKLKKEQLESQKNDLNSFLFLGIQYYYGCGVDQNYQNARKNFDKIIKINKEHNAKHDYINLSYALLYMGHLYKNGYEGKPNYSEAKKYYELSEHYNNPEAMFELSLIYFNGLGVKQDHKIALEYLKKGIQQNNNLNDIFDESYFVFDKIKYDKSIIKSKEYYELSSFHNNSQALLKLRSLCLNGFSIEDNYIKSKEYYKIMAQLNNSDALFYLGKLFYDGIAVKQDYSKALEFFNLSSEFNNTNALLHLGFLYEYGNGVKQDYKNAFVYYQLAANLKNSNAFLQLGHMYEYGYTGEKSYEKTIYYYNKASKYNDYHAFYNLGCIYCEKFDIPRDYPLSKFYFDKSIMHVNNSNSLLMLGKFYYYGYYFEQSDIIAKKYFKQSAKFQNSEASKILGDIYFYGYGTENKLERSKQYYKESANLNNPEALFMLGKIYKIKNKTDKSKEKIEESAKLNNPDALFYLGSNETDIKKSEYYLRKCCEIEPRTVKKYHSIENLCIYSIEINKYYYISNNDLGLIYLFVHKDIENAKKYLQKAYLGQYSFAQNNFGLLHEFYLNNTEKAIEMYKIASQNNFALAEFNLGRIKGKEGKIVDSVEHYKKAIKLANEPLIFRNIKHHDKKLEISIKFVVCFINEVILLLF